MLYIFKILISKKLHKTPSLMKILKKYGKMLRKVGEIILTFGDRNFPVRLN